MRVVPGLVPRTTTTTVTMRMVLVSSTKLLPNNILVYAYSYNLYSLTRQNW